jgi:hypothetical protein
MRKQIYPEVGTCIYCYSDGEGLGLRTEHIIPGGLGGRLELPCASCRPCEQETSALEGRVLNGIYGYSRAHLGVRREQPSKKKWPPTLPVTTWDEAGAEKVEVAREAHPNLTTVIKWRPPEIYFHGRPDDSGIKDALMDGLSDDQMWKKAKNVAKTARKKRISLNQGGGSVDDFARFLAKIGHSFAVAELGLRGFKPTLLNAILDKRPMYLSYYVGMSIIGTGLLPPAPDVHEINIREEQISRRNLLVVRVQLFADIPIYDPRRRKVMGMPAYDVFVGEIA